MCVYVLCSGYLFSKAVILMVAVTDWGIKLLFWLPVLIGG
jgi:hypothetical protein